MEASARVRQPVVLVPGVVQQHILHRLDAHGHLHDVVLDQLQAANLLPLDNALVGVLAGILIGAQSLTIGIERIDQALDNRSPWRSPSGRCPRS